VVKVEGGSYGWNCNLKEDWSRQSYGLTLSYEVNGNEMRHTNWE